MIYEAHWERFNALAPDGKQRAVEFIRAGFLTAGDQPELYFFHVDGEEVVVGISGSALRRFQQRRRLTREEKIDLAGLMLKQQIALGAALEPQNLSVRDGQLAQLADELGIAE